MSHAAFINFALLVTTSVLCAAAGVVIWARVHVAGARAMALLLFCGAVNCAAYAVEFVTSSADTKVALERALVVGWEIMPTLYFVFALQYTGRGRRLTRTLIAILCVMPVLGLAFALTEGSHHLLFSGYAVPPGDPYLGLDRDFGPAFWVHAAYAYALLAFGTVLLLGLFWRSWSLYRGQAVALLIAILLPWVADVITLSGLQPIAGLDVETIGFALMALFLAYALTRLRVSDVLAVSRTTILDSLRDAVMVLDRSSTVLYANPAGSDLLERLVPRDETPTRRPVWPKSIHGLPLGVSSTSDPAVMLRLAEGEQTHDVRLAPVLDAGGQVVAHVLVARDVTEQLRVEEELRASGARYVQALDATVKALSAVVESRDPYTTGHQRRVAALAGLIAEEVGLSPDGVRGIRVAGEVHDVGKIQVPVEILSRPGRISEAEFAIVKEHSESGYQILKGVDFPWPVAEMVRQHHEKLDGSGYPLGLRGDEILVQARILCVADVVEAMSSDRPYRAALGVPAALAEISAHRGSWFDPDVVDACLRVLERRGYELPGE